MPITFTEDDFSEAPSFTEADFESRTPEREARYQELEREKIKTRGERVDERLIGAAEAGTRFLESVPRQLFNTPANLVNLVAGRPVLKTLQPGESPIPEILPDVNTLSMLPIPGQLAPMGGPTAGIVKGAEDLIRSVAAPEVLMTLPAGGGGALARPLLARAPAAAFGAQMVQHLPEAYQEFGRATVEGTPAEAFRAGAGALGATAMIGAIGAGGIEPRPIPRTPMEIEWAAAAGAQPQRQLGIRIPPGEMFLPEAQPLASRALHEAQGSVLPPGQEPALMQLRRAVMPPEVVLAEQAKLAERVPGGGEAPYGKTSYQRQAEAPLTTRGIAASVREKLANQKAGSEAGHIDLSILKEVVDFGRTIYQKGMDFAKWSAEMVKHLGDKSADYLQHAWDQITSTEKGAPNASAITSTESVPQPEVRARMGEEASLRQPGEAPGTQEAVQPLPAEKPGGAETKGVATTSLRERDIGDLSDKQITNENGKQIADKLEVRWDGVQDWGLGPGKGLVAMTFEEGPAKGATFYAPEGVTGAQVRALAASKLAEFEKPAKPPSLTPAVRSEDGVIETAADHGTAVLQHGRAGRIAVKPQDKGFVDENSKFLSRAEAAKKFEEMTGKKPRIADSLSSEDLKAAGLVGERASVNAPKETSGAPVGEQSESSGAAGSPEPQLELDESTAQAYRENSIKLNTESVARIVDLMKRRNSPQPLQEYFSDLLDWNRAKDNLAKSEERSEQKYGSQIKEAMRKAMREGKAPFSDPQVLKLRSLREQESAAAKDIFDDVTQRFSAEDSPGYVTSIFDLGSLSQSPKFSQVKNLGQWINEILVESIQKPNLISKLESLKFDPGQAGSYSLPHPDAIKAIGKDIWNTGINIAIATVKAGKSIGEAIDAAMKYFRDKSGGKFNEDHAIANLEYITKSKIKPVPETEGESAKMRKSAERATTAEMVPEPVQETIKTAPESFYKQQSMQRVEDVVSSMSDADLAAVSSDSNLYTASRLEQAKRLFDRGENDAGYNVFVELEKQGTLMGQLINQFKLLKGSRPESIIQLVNTTLTKAGKDVLTKEQEATGLEIARKSKEADADLSKATSAWQKNPSAANSAKAEKALDNSNAEALELQKFIAQFQPRSLPAILKSILQGNLLTPISETANLVGNMSFLPFRATDRTIASGLDLIDSAVRGKPREITVQPLTGTAEALKGFGRGVKQIPGVLARGTGNVIKGETRAGLHPIQAWINQFAKNPETPTTGGKLTLSDRLGLAIEGTLGIPAESMLRGLGAGDVAFKEAAKARVTATELNLAKVPKNQWGFAQKFPELFLDDAALQRIQSGTLEAVFQRPSKTLNSITRLIKGKGDFKGDLIDFFAATVAPYKVTPWNIVGEILSYNPLVAMARTAAEAKSGNTRQAKLNAGKFVVGSMLTATGWWLYKNGLMSPSLDQRDEAQKARILSGQVMPPNHINLSGLKRKIAGGDPAFKPGDETRDVFRSGGLAGSMFYMTANIGRDMERSPQTSGVETWGRIIRESTLEQARFGMNQSFLSGVEGLLTAIREGNVDTYLRQWGNTVASIPLPNTLTVMSRATRENKPDFRAEGFKGQVENIVRNRLGMAKLDDYLPIKRGLWGEPLPETPKDRNAIVYHFFDVFKGQQVTSDPVPLELYSLWRKTGDSRVIPSLVEKAVTIGNQSYPLTAAQESRYAELVGQSRRRIVDALVVNPEYHKLPDEAKIKLLDRVYDAGLAKGKDDFWKETGTTLTPKPARAGFAPAQPPVPIPPAF